MKVSIELNGHPFNLHLYRPAGASSENVLIIYATGDGGWWGLGRAIYNQMVKWDYPVVGFSSKSYLNNLKHVSATGTTTPRLLSEDYKKIVAVAENRLSLPPTTRIIFAGVSRGAGLSLVAAGARNPDQPPAGLLAISLTKEEEFVLHHPRGTPGTSDSGHPGVMIDTYRYLNRLGPIPVMVLQSTQDDYLPAAEARMLFGPDTETRKMRAVEAVDHSFHKGREILYKDAENAMKWIVSLLR